MIIWETNDPIIPVTVQDSALFYFCLNNEIITIFLITILDKIVPKQLHWCWCTKSIIAKAVLGLATKLYFSACQLWASHVFQVIRGWPLRQESEQEKRSWKIIQEKMCTMYFIRYKMHIRHGGCKLQCCDNVLSPGMTSCTWRGFYLSRNSYLTNS